MLVDCFSEKRPKAQSSSGCQFVIFMLMLSIRMLIISGNEMKNGAFIIKALQLFYFSLEMPQKNQQAILFFTPSSQKTSTIHFQYAWLLSHLSADSFLMLNSLVTRKNSMTTVANFISKTDFTTEEEH